ncbi:PEP-CTERM sorting domain-containing protein [Akkermansiaceae bacterium]|jgi:hypothetical protein|nr:PEP-CTERM sorting domain-containing protein [Akkermansiaceae bacterium]
MHNKILLNGAVFVATCLSASGVITWTGGGAESDFYDSANWDFSGSSSSEMVLGGGNPSAGTDDDITISGATINESSGAFSNIEIGEGLEVTLDGTSFTFTNNNGFTGLDNNDDVLATLNLLGGSSLSAQFAAIGITVNVDSTSSVVFRGGGDPINSQLEKTTINLEPGAQLTLPTVAEFTEQGADIVVGGVTFAADPSILTFNGTTATANVVIPEPSSSLLVGLSLFGLLSRRRK